MWPLECFRQVDYHKRMAHQLGFIGLGKMGKLMVSRLREQGIDVVAYNRTPIPDATFPTVPTMEELVATLSAPRVMWLMIPNGPPIDEVIQKLLAAGVASGDTVIDGGNTLYKDTVRRASFLKEKGINFIDCGTSGGLEGAKNGACLMLGGVEDAVMRLTWLWDALSEKRASQGEAVRSWNYMGPSGAGHFVKMVHNGIEYGMDEAIGEGVEILAKGPYHLDIAKVVATWSHGSIIRSYLVELLVQALAQDPRLDQLTGRVGGGETGAWTVETAKELGVDAAVLAAALEARNRSQSAPTMTTKVVSALRKAYGGHKEAA